MVNSNRYSGKTGNGQCRVKAIDWLMLAMSSLKDEQRLEAARAAATNRHTLIRTTVDLPSDVCCGPIPGVALRGQPIFIATCRSDFELDSQRFVTFFRLDKYSLLLPVSVQPLNRAAQGLAGTLRRMLDMCNDIHYTTMPRVTQAEQLLAGARAMGNVGNMRKYETQLEALQATIGKQVDSFNELQAVARAEAACIDDALFVDYWKNTIHAVHNAVGFALAVEASFKQDSADDQAALNMTAVFSGMKKRWGGIPTLGTIYNESPAYWPIELPREQDTVLPLDMEFMSPDFNPAVNAPPKIFLP